MDFETRDCRERVCYVKYEWIVSEFRKFVIISYGLVSCDCFIFYVLLFWVVLFWVFLKLLEGEFYCCFSRYFFDDKGS